MRRLKAQDGFSLVESLCVLAIAGLLSVLLLGSFGFFGAAWRHSASQSDRSGDVYAAQSVLRRIAMGFTNATGGARFEGNAAQFELTSRFALPGEAPAPTNAKIGLEGEPQSQSLVLSVAQQRDGNARPIIRVPLVSGAKSIEIAYLAPGGDWLTSWPASKGAPKLVRVTLQFEEGTRHAWPALYLALGAAL